MKLYDELVARGLIAQTTNEAEIREMIEEQKPISVNCHFCNREYSFSPAQLKELLGRCGKE